jgi:DNA mismatch endonuclease, patch repair protein
MVDFVSAAFRSRMMAGIKAKDTKPEMLVRRRLHGLGFRYRLHDKKLPGKPDLVFPRYNAVIFVNGCFWHGHGCPAFRWPKSRADFWRQKIGRNIANDIANRQKLEAMGWRHLTVWECVIGRTKTSIPDATIGPIKRWILAEKLPMVL